MAKKAMTKEEHDRITRELQLKDRESGKRKPAIKPASYTPGGKSK